MSDAETENPRERPCVLVVDDDRMSSKMAALKVQALGYEAIAVTSWVDALRSFKERRVSVVLMDAMMPTVDGFKLTRMLRQHPGPYTPILFLTGLDDADSRQRCLDAGADEVLTKPLDDAELKMRLEATLEKREPAPPTAE